jgi:hypothetical protein
MITETILDELKRRGFEAAVTLGNPPMMVVDTLLGRYTIGIDGDALVMWRGGLRRKSISLHDHEVFDRLVGVLVEERGGRVWGY